MYVYCTGTFFIFYVCILHRHASRVAASSARLFTDIPHMMVPTLEAYKQQAVALGRKRGAMRRLKARVQEQRLDSPLFDTQRWVRERERASQNHRF